MRALQLQTPNMSGPDVIDWQTFLKGQSLLQGTADGDFGPMTDQATRAYQSDAGLTPDGVVGPGTMAKALAAGYQSTTGANLGGMDTNIDCSASAAQLPGQGMQFVARYYSDDPAKTLSAAEARDLSAAGLDTVVVFEDFNNSADRFSAAAGASQAAKALSLAAAIGQPAASAIYFAVDYDASSADVAGPITEYFAAIQSAFAGAPVQYAVGVYGSGLICSSIRAAGLAQFAWLAQSMGYQGYMTFRPQADLVQLAPSRTLPNGISIDDDIAQNASFGAFRVAQVQVAAAPAT